MEIEKKLARTEKYSYIQMISGIPIAITDNHNEVFNHWFANGIKNADLFHIDAHADMRGRANLNERLGIGNFICPSFHLDIVSSVYWLNPQARNGLMLKCMGSRYDAGQGKLLQTKTTYDGLIDWTIKTEGVHYKRMLNGKVISTEELVARLKQPFILDIDLDAFCCHRHQRGYYSVYDSDKNFPEKVDKAIECLRRLAKPNIITITLSKGSERGEHYVPAYVPKDKVDEILHLLILRLTQVFQEKKN